MAQHFILAMLEKEAEYSLPKEAATSADEQSTPHYLLIKYYNSTVTLFALCSFSRQVLPTYSVSSKKRSTAALSAVAGVGATSMRDASVVVWSSWHWERYF